MEHGHNNPIIAIFLAIGSFLGFASISLSEIDLVSAIALKWVSILSFTVAICFTVWKWKTKREIHKKTMEILSDKKNEHGADIEKD